MSIVRIKEVLPIVIFIFILKPLLLLLLLICVTDLARKLDVFTESCQN